MTKSQGRIRTEWCLAVTGNKNGLVGKLSSQSHHIKGSYHNYVKSTFLHRYRCI